MPSTGARQVVRVTAYRARANLARQRAGLVALVLLLGLVGGLALGSLAAARRTASSFPVFWAAAHPSDLIGVTGLLNPLIGSTTGYDGPLLRTIAHLPHVDQVQSYSGIDFLPLRADGAPLDAPNFYPPAAGNGYGSDGLYFDQDRVTVTAGRMADPTRANEFMMTAAGAQALGLHVGQTLPIGIYTNAQTNLPGFGTARVKPHRVLRETLVGIAVFPNSVVQDDVDVSGAPDNLFTPALTRQFLDCCANYTLTGLTVRGGAADVDAVAHEVQGVLPAGFPPFSGTTSIVAKADRAIRPEAIALGAFGGVVALAALLIAGQLIARQLLLAENDRFVLRALGAGPATTLSDGLVGMVGAVVAGSVLAVAVAVGLSPLAPLGPVRAVYPDIGVNADWTVLGGGFALFVLVLSATAVVLAYRGAPARAALRAERAARRPSRAVGAAVASGLPPPAVAGLRMALGSGNGTAAVPMRSTIAGTVLAVVVLVSTVTFGASLDHLVSHPALYGWNWDQALVAGADIPQAQATSLLDADHDVAAWSGVYTSTLNLDGTPTPVLGVTPGAPVGPPILNGNPIDGPGQIVVGAVTLTQMGKHIGQDVTLTTNDGKSRRVRIVGIAAFPALGTNSGGAHLELGVGAVVAASLIPAADKNPFDNPVPGPNLILVRFRDGADPTAALHSLDRIARATSNTFNFGVSVTGVLRPAEIVNYRTLGTTPAYLSAGLAAGALAALTLTLLASVRRRRRDLALLKTLGFTRRQLGATVAWHATVTVLAGIVIGIPIGIALGRWLWDLFARNINVVPSPTVPALWVLVIAVGALVLANLVAALPARLAARTPSALALRSE